jgi:hypothetical protein
MSDLTEAPPIKQSRAVRQVLSPRRGPLRSARSLLTRAIAWLRRRIGRPVRLAKSLFMATIGKDRGFGFWWLVMMAAIAFAIGLLVTILLSPVIGIIAALIVGIWMLVRRSRSSQSRKPALAQVAG